jgi:uncharacterized protein YneF (UPF0154 family)
MLYRETVREENMAANQLLSKLQRAILKPEPLWEEEVAHAQAWDQFYKSTVLPVIAVAALLSAVLFKIFGYHLPMIGIVRPSVTDMLLQIAGAIVMYSISLLVLGWIAAWLAGMMGGKNDFNRAVSMLFWISVPSFLGQILGTLPMVGWVISLGMGLYSLVLLYRAIPVFMDVSVTDRVKHFIFFLIASFVVSILLGTTLGRIFTPRDMLQSIRPDVIVPPQTEKSTKALPHKSTSKSSDNPVEDYMESMAKGDYNKDVIEKAKQDQFTPPADGRLTKAQVEHFLTLAKKVKIVEKEQAQKLKEKYDKKEQSDEFSITDVFNGFKDFTSLATLEMKVVKENGGNWAEYTWVKDRVREAYYTPSLSPTTEYNAKFLKGHEDLLKKIL